MKKRETKINLAHSEIYAGLSVIWFLVIEYEELFSVEDFAKIEEQVQFAKEHADLLAEVARRS